MKRRGSSSLINRSFAKGQTMAFAGVISGFLFALELSGDEFLRIDRLQHALLSAALVLIFFAAWGFRSRFLAPAVAGSLALGLAKELTDPSPQVFDVWANLLGVALALILLFYVYRLKGRGPWRLS